MKVLVINCGSSSIKYKLYHFPKKKLLAKGLIDRIGARGGAAKSHSHGTKLVFQSLLKQGAIRGLDEISVIGHRVVHGAENFRKPTIINNRVIKKIKECSKLAPLHNPANLAGILGCKKLLPKVVQVAVFDTAFHQTIPESAYMYAVPERFYKKYKVRKYGFHGTSHQFIAQQAAKVLKKPLNKLKLITCHLGNGCSVTAVDRAKSVDTSMGFTPLEGLVMGTRCGDIDVAAVFYIMQKAKLSIGRMDNILNKESGLLGVSRISNDIRPIRKKAKKGNPLAKLALGMFIYRIEKYIGAYLLALGGADAVCFTAGIGENCPDITNRIKKDIKKLTNNKTKVLIIHTDEELMIADHAYHLAKKR